MIQELFRKLLITLQKLGFVVMFALHSYDLSQKYIFLIFIKESCRSWNGPTCLFDFVNMPSL